MPGPNDPAAFFRDMLGQWERMANSFGNDAMKSQEFARGMQGASGAGMAMQAAFREHMEKALSAANIPTRGEVDALSARLTAIEATLARIEARLASGDGDPAPAPQDKPAKPARTRRASKD